MLEMSIHIGGKLLFSLLNSSFKQRCVQREGQRGKVMFHILTMILIYHFSAVSTQNLFFKKRATNRPRTNGRTDPYIEIRGRI